MATAEIWTGSGSLMEEKTKTTTTTTTTTTKPPVGVDSTSSSSSSSPATANGAVSLRRRRMEIRRIKMMTTTAAASSFVEQPVSKRLRPVWGVGGGGGDGGAGLRGRGGKAGAGGVGSESPAARLQQDGPAASGGQCIPAGDGIREGGSGERGWCVGRGADGGGGGGGLGAGDDGDECASVGDQSSGRKMHQQQQQQQPTSGCSDESSTVTFAAGFHGGALGAEEEEGAAAATGECFAASEAVAAVAAAAAAAEVQSAGAEGTEKMATTETVTEAAQLEDGSLWRGEGESSAAAAAVVVAGGAPGDCFASNACPPHGMVSLCGRRREMEDAVVSIDSFVMLPCQQAGGCDAEGLEAAPMHYFGVYDGHGGSQAANFCAERLHQALAEEVESCFVQGQNVDQGSVDWESKWLAAMTQSFKRMDAEVGGFCLVETECNSGENSRCCPEPIAPETVGTTAIVAVVGACQIIVGNCGDSRAVLSRGGVAIPLSVDHKPEREDEMARVEAAGGRVIYWNGYRVLGVLAMSRAIGDRYLKPYIIPEPEVKCVKRADDDECLILASDGLWDVMSNEVVCDVARRALNCRRNGQPPDPSLGTNSEEETPAAQAAALLVKLALAKGSSDNISVVVVDLKVKR